MDNKGFTLMELMITLLIMVVVGVFAFLNYSGKKTNTELTSLTQEIVTLVHEAQSRTMAGDQNGTAGTGFWGVQLANPTNTADFFALLYATSTANIASGTVLGHYPLPPSVAFTTSSIASGGTLYIYFGNGLFPGIAMGANDICTGYSCPAGTSTIVVGLFTPNQKPPASSTISVLPTGAVGY